MIPYYYNRSALGFKPSLLYYERYKLYNLEKTSKTMPDSGPSSSIWLPKLTIFVHALNLNIHRSFIKYSISNEGCR